MPPSSNSVLSRLPKDSAWALSWRLPRRLMLCTAPFCASRDLKRAAAHRQLWSERTTGPAGDQRTAKTRFSASPTRASGSVSRRRPSRRLYASNGRAVWLGTARLTVQASTVFAVSQLIESGGDGRVGGSGAGHTSVAQPFTPAALRLLFNLNIDKCRKLNKVITFAWAFLFFYQPYVVSR